MHEPSLRSLCKHLGVSCWMRIRSLRPSVFWHFKCVGLFPWFVFNFKCARAMIHNLILWFCSGSNWIEVYNFGIRANSRSIKMEGFICCVVLLSAYLELILVSLTGMFSIVFYFPLFSFSKMVAGFLVVVCGHNGISIHRWD